MERVAENLQGHIVRCRHAQGVSQTCQAMFPMACDAATALVILQRCSKHAAAHWVRAPQSSPRLQCVNISSSTDQTPTNNACRATCFLTVLAPTSCFRLAAGCALSCKPAGNCCHSTTASRLPPLHITGATLWGDPCMLGLHPSDHNPSLLSTANLGQVWST